MESINIWGVLIGLAIVYLFLVVRWVPKPYNWIIEINLPIGGTKTISYVWQPGIHFLWFPVAPFMYVRNKVNMAHKVIQLNLGMTTGFGNPNRIDFTDGTDAGLEVQVTYVVIDPIKATYGVQENTVAIEHPDKSGIRVFEGYEVATLNRVEAQLRSFFGSMTFNEANSDSKRDELEKAILENMRKFIQEHWGLEILDVDLMDFDLDKKLIENRQRVLSADITAVALKREAEGQADAIITVAGANKQAADLAGQGELARLKAVTGAGLNPAQAAAYVLSQESMRALERGNTTVIATSEGGNLSQLATMAGMLKGVLGGGNDSPPPTPVPTQPNPPSPVSPTPTASAADSVETSDRPPHPQDEQGGFRTRRRSNR